MKTKLFLFALCAMFLAGCASMTPAETTAVVTGGAGALAAFIKALAPMLPPEKVAELTSIAGDVQTVTDAVAASVRAIAEAMSQTKQQVATLQANTFTTSEVGGLVAGGSATAVTAAASYIRWRRGATERERQTLRSTSPAG